MCDMHACACVHVCVRMCVYTCMSKCMYVCKCIYSNSAHTIHSAYSVQDMLLSVPSQLTCVCACACVYVCAHVRVHVYVQVHVHVQYVCKCYKVILHTPFTQPTAYRTCCSQYL